MNKNDVEILIPTYNEAGNIEKVIEDLNIEGFENITILDANSIDSTVSIAKKYNCKIVPLYIERVNNINFNIKIEKPIEFSKDTSTEEITRNLNIWLERMILKNPSKWIWSHNRWK